jgi:DNA-binding beta-propeller fold protein YncE
MMSFSVGRLPHGLLITFVWALLAAESPQLWGGTPAQAADAQDTDAIAPAPSAIKPPLPVQLQFLGRYSAEGKFQTPTEVNKWLSEHATDDPRIERKGMRPVAIPPAFPLTPVERTVEDFPANYHARAPIRGHRHLVGWLNAMATLAYGNEKPLLGPQHVTTDSRGRVIIADPKVPAIHVLDGKNSFRIVGGVRRRLQNPNGVAVDANDNIYVADSSLGLILVYDPLGRYLRSIGQIAEHENLLLQPAGIAIDRTHQRLYVVDSTRDRLFAFSLLGQPLYRLGMHGEDSALATFDYPTDVALTGDGLAVLDQGGARVQMMDFAGHLRTSFVVALMDPLHRMERGLAADKHQHVFISNLSASTIRVFSSDGKVLSTVNQPVVSAGNLKSPEGLWVDSSMRMFVADSEGQQVQVFQLAEGDVTSSLE